MKEWKLFVNPSSIEHLDPIGDFQLTSALLHFRGAGKNVPDPEVRKWYFKNGFGVQATTVRDFLMIGDLYYNVSAGEVLGPVLPLLSAWKRPAPVNLIQLNEERIRELGLPTSVFMPKENQTIEEIEAYLMKVKNFQASEKAEQ